MNKELARKVIIPYYFTDRNLKVGFKINLDALEINHDNSKLTSKPNYPEFGFGVRYVGKIIKQYLSFMLD